MRNLITFFTSLFKNFLYYYKIKMKIFLLQQIYRCHTLSLVNWIKCKLFIYHVNTLVLSFDQETWDTFGHRAASATSTVATDLIFSPRISMDGFGLDPVPRSDQRPSVTPETGVTLEDTVNRSQTTVKLHRFTCQNTLLWYTWIVICDSDRYSHTHVLVNC